MPRPTDINPKTGKRYNFVDPKKVEQERAAAIREQQADIDRAKRLLAAVEARDDLLKFIRFTMPDPEAPNDHTRSRYENEAFHEACAKALEDVEAGKVVQLIFCMPPRHGKTEMATKRFAAWSMGRHPSWDVAVASYSDTMAEDMGADTRAIMLSPTFKTVFPGFALRRGGTSKSNIQTVAGGRGVFVGRGGALTGRGANLLLIDDLYKDHEEARSQAVRDQTWNWFTKVAMTRRMGLKLVVITMTRWHSDDIIGRLTDPENPHYNAEEAKKWRIIRLPAIAEDEDDPAGRKPGEPLWPARYDLDYLESQRRLDPLGFAALFQQRPTVADGVLFERHNIKRYKRAELPANLRYYCASDHAVATGQRNDFTVLLKVGVDENSNIYVTDCIWKKMTSDAAVEAMLAMGSGKAKPLLWWAEKGHISKSIGPFLRKRMLETGTHFVVREVTPIGDKEQRAQSIAARVAMGKVYFPEEDMWADRAIDQMLAFPAGTHDDFVDAFAYIGLGIGSQFAASKPKQVKQEPTFGTLGWVKMMDKWQKERDGALQRGGF